MKPRPQQKAFLAVQLLLLLLLVFDTSITVVVNAESAADDAARSAAAVQPREPTPVPTDKPAPPAQLPPVPRATAELYEAPPSPPTPEPTPGPETTTANPASPQAAAPRPRHSRRSERDFWQRNQRRKLARQKEEGAGGGQNSPQMVQFIISTDGSDRIFQIGIILLIVLPLAWCVIRRYAPAGPAMTRRFTPT